MTLKTKFNITEKVFFLENDTIQEKKIDAISVHINYLSRDEKVTQMTEYFFSNSYEIKAPISADDLKFAVTRRYEYQIFSTKEELLKSL